MGARRERVWAIDALRGGVMVLMALDHVRDFWAGPNSASTNLGQANATTLLFLTRWVTHFCAPVFVLLAGTSAWLHGRRCASRAALARFLVTRGLWLLVLEFTLIYHAWMLSFGIAPFFFQVIAAIGLSMIVLGGLVFLPQAAIVLVGLALVLGHNLFDGTVPEDLGAAGGLWVLLHEGSLTATPRLIFPAGLPVLVVYPVLPWIGVMALGYALGPWVELARQDRRRRFLFLGLVLTLGFVLVRLWNGYGDPSPWEARDGALGTLLSFVNTTKYPPSLLFLAMTLGPSLVVLAWLDRPPPEAEPDLATEPPGPVSRAMVTFGRVPLFFYVAHLYLAHAGVWSWYRLVHGQGFSEMQAAFTGSYPEDYAPFPIAGVYAVWIAAVLVLWPLCAAYGALKRRSRSPLLSYL